MAVDKEVLETMRKWGTTLIIVFIAPFCGLWMRYNNMQTMKDVRDMFVEQRTYISDRGEYLSEMKSLNSKMDTVLQNQASQSTKQLEQGEHLKAIEARIERGK